MAPKGKRPKPVDKDFLFVNEDFSTLFGGAKNAELDRSKQSHVQRHSFVRRKRLETKESRRSSVSPSDKPDTAVSGAQTLIERQPEVAPSPSDSQLPQVTFKSPGDAWLPPASSEQDEDWLRHHDQDEVNQDSASAWPTIDNDWILHGAYQQDYTFQRTASFAALPAQTRSSVPSASSGVSSPAPLAELQNPMLISNAPSLWPPDPFTDFKAALEQWAPPLMRYFTGVMVHDLFRFDLKRVSMKHLRHVDGLHADMQSCMNHPEEMYALLASTSCYILAREGHLDLPSVTPETYHRVPILFKTKALEALRVRLSSGAPSHGTVIAVHRMVSAALYTSHFDAVETHYRASLSMIEGLGGLETFDDFQKERLIFHDLDYAAEVSSLPRFQLSWDPGPLSAAVAQEISSEDETLHSAAFQRLTDLLDSEHKLENAELFETLGDIIEVERTAHWLENREYSPEYYRWLMHRRLALLHRLMKQEQFTFGGESTDALGSAREVLRLATIFFMILVLHLPENMPRLTVQAEIMVGLLQAADAVEDLWPFGHDLLIWVIVMAGMCTVATSDRTTIDTSTVSASERDASFLLGDLGRQRCAELEIETISGLQELLQGFLFSSDLIDRRFTTFAEMRLGLHSQA